MPVGAKHQKVWRAVNGGFTNTISGLKYRWGGTRVRADIPPVFGGITAAQTAGEGGVKIPPERLVEANESDGALTPPPVLECTGAAQKAGEVWASKPTARDERETENGEHVNRPPVLGSPGGAEAAGRGRAPKMLACSGLIVEKDAFVLQGDGKIAPSMDGHPADTEGRRRGRNDGRTGGTKTAGAQSSTNAGGGGVPKSPVRGEKRVYSHIFELAREINTYQSYPRYPAGAAACRSGPNGGAAGMYETAITARADGQGTHEGTRSIEYG
ncbi:hypothetical protein C8R44DRAFT_951625 [Mycena epipterygia]|nr:hypothetical protein C8R44DRAFT_951625 [Mycena epipterygia]